jgi:ComF family protein
MLTAIVDKFRRDSINALAPERCQWCGVATVARPVCDGCHAALPWNLDACRACALPLAATAGSPDPVCRDCLIDSPPQDRSWAAFRYAMAVSQQIVDLKFHGHFAPAHVLGTLMAERLATRTEPLPEMLLPVPLHTQRLRRRGYNQALELGRAIARRLSIQLLATAATRVRPTAEQSRLDATGRRHNVRGAFTVAEVVRGRHVALLDDVITTGATMREFARAARAAGARRIEVWAAARVA